MKKEINIQLLRITSMFMILACHFFNELGNTFGNSLAQFFNVGVFIFIIISGYLFGKKNIDNVKEWYIKRGVRIFIPLWIWTIVVNIIYAIMGMQDKISIKYIVITILNLQGFFGTTLGLSHLWFLSVIMICYFITPILQKFRNQNFKKIFLILLGLMICSVAISFANKQIGRYLFICLVYVFAYYYSSLKLNIISVKNIYVYALIILAIILRIIGKKYLDNTIIYTNFIVLLTHTLIAMGIFILFKKININLKNKIILKLIDNIDNISLYVYIVHYIFCVGPIDIVNKWSYQSILEIILTIFLSTVIAFILWKICNKITKHIMNYLKNQ